VTTTQEHIDALRTDELSRLGVLDRPAGNDLQALVELTAQLCDVPKVAVNLISRDSQHQVAAAGFDPGICTREDSMCAAVLDEPDPVVVADASQDDRFAANPFVTGQIGDVRFYASSPLVTRNGVHIGRLCVFDDVPHELDESKREMLPLLADRVVDILELSVYSRDLQTTVDELSRTRLELHRSNASLSAFAEQISHDLRTPLTGVMTGIELLVDEPAIAADEELVSILSGALRSGRRMAAMIERILEQARIGARVDVEEIDLAEVVEGVREDLAPLLGIDDAQIVHPDLPVLHADGRLIHVVLLNLVSNAVKFTRPHRQPVVTISAGRTSSGWRIAVADNGPGIPPEQRERVFEQYARGHDDVEGSGIGLASVRRILTAHGGSIGIEEADEGGALVWVELPDPWH
jgi:signal transduction histidine kinase